MTEAANDRYSAALLDFPEGRIVRKPGGGGLDGPGEPPHESGMDPAVTQLQNDFRDLLKGGIAAFVLAFTAMVVSFFFLIARIDSSFDKVDGKLDKISAQVAGMQTDVAVLKGRPAKP